MPHDLGLAKLLSLRGEYLFFIGAIYLALLLALRRRWFGALAAFAAGVAWITYHLPVSLYLASLGPDSFAETHGFNLSEARFWLSSLHEAVYPMFSLRKFVAYLVVAVLSFFALRYVLQRRAGLSARSYTLAKLLLAGVCMAVALDNTAGEAVAAYLDNAKLFKVTIRNFDHPAPALAPAAPPPRLVVYIGESTSVMNMGLYGYPRNTTPELDGLARADPGLLVFRHVFSTHSHTSRSLLEALSFGLAPHEELLPIERRQRVSLVDVLGKAGLAPRMVSNQGQGGAWDHTAAVIFRHSDNSIRVKQALAPGAAPPPRWDDAYFAAELDRQARHGARPVTFLHSYAGHGPYLENIPERFRTPVDARLDDLSAQQVLDNPALSVDQVQAYDSAIRYVDHSVASVLERVRRWPQPGILVYFSDHGDAVFKGRGHDSARFSHEMGRVPLLIYFNEAARQARPALFEKYRQLAATGELSTLAQLPSTLLDLLGLHVSGAERPALITTPVFGEPTVPPPVMVREQGDATTAIDLTPRPLPAVTPQGRRVVDATDEDTREFIAIRTGRLPARQVCAGRPSTFEDLSRRILLADCAGIRSP